MDHEGVVVVPVKLGTVAVCTISEIPIAIFLKASLKPRAVNLFAGKLKKHLDHGGKQLPIAFRRLNAASLLYRLYQISLNTCGNFVPELNRSAQNGFCKESGVDEWLCAL